MLYRFDPASPSPSLDALVPVSATGAGVLEKQIEQAVANHPEALFNTGVARDPVLVVRCSAPGRKMPDIIALDGEGRLVLVECKRGWADRDTLAQLLDYAADYAADPLRLLDRDWSYGRGRNAGESLLAAFRRFAEDEEFDHADLGREQILVVVASGEAPGFKKISKYLEGRGDLPEHLQGEPPSLQKRSMRYRLRCW